MQLLVIGDALSPYTVAFSRFLKQHSPTITIDIINTRPNVIDVELTEQIRRPYAQFYTSQIITTVINQVNEKISQYDVICLHGFWDIVLSIYKWLNHKNIFTVGVIWGSDFYRRNHDMMPLSGIFDRCDRVLVQTDEMEADLLKIYPLPPEKIRKCLFGIEPLESLVAMSDISSKEAKRSLDLPEDSFVITCGYNASPFQNHIAIIDQLTAVISRLPSNYVLIFPFTYQKNRQYISHIQNLITKSPLTYYFIEDFMDSEKVSLLCLATDIFIQVQKTDALSASMREHLFAKSIVITGGWLPYQILERNGIYFETIDELNSLGKKITGILDNLPEVRRNVETNNTPDKFEQYRWPKVIQQWYEVFLEYKTEKRDSIPNTSIMFSIITPLHNNASTLSETFYSLKNQYYENWEWIIIDDCSEDNGLAIARSLSHADKRISIYQNSGRNGACACRNIGIENSKGEYLIFLDPDDMLREYCLSERLKALKKNIGLHMLISKTAFFTANNPNNIIRIVGAIKPTYEEMISAFVSHNILWTGTSITWKRDFLERIGGWNVEYPRLQDVELNVRALLQKPLISNCNSVDLLYRCDNFTHQKKVNAITGFNLLLRDYYFRLCNDETEDNIITLYKGAFKNLIKIIVHYLNTINHSNINSDKKYFVETLLTICDEIKDVKHIAKMIDFDFEHT